MEAGVLTCAEIPVSTKPANSAPQQSEFGNLLGKLVQVPKSEMQAEEAKWQAMRERLRKKGEAKGATKRKRPPAD
jgi:hypothetical protein